MEPSLTSRVLVAGAGIAGAACSSALHDAGVEVTVHDASPLAGGRMCTRELHGRMVDLGAAYFTVSDARFASVVDVWAARGLVRPWTDSFAVLAPSGRSEKSGPQRWVAPDGLAALVADTHVGSVDYGAPVDHLDEACDAVVLAMPDQQAELIVGGLVDWVEYEPVIAVAAGWDRHEWDLPTAAFVNDDPHVSLIADDGSRRGDAAPVLVAHTTTELARQHLDDPEHAGVVVVDAVRRLLDIGPPPLWRDVTLWPAAKPAATHGDQPFALVGAVGVCGDSWCPSGSPRVEAAWLSGHRLGVELADRLA